MSTALPNLQTNVTSTVSIGVMTTTSAPTHHHEEHSVFSVINLIICVLILVLGVFGNLLVLIVFSFRRKKLKACEVFMMSLAAADLIGTMVVPSSTFMEVLGRDFRPIGDGGCKVIFFFAMASISVSAITLVVISIDRFVIVKWPLRKRPELSSISIAVMCTWVVGCGTGLPYLIGDRMKLYELSSELYICRDFGSEDEIESQTLAVMFVQIILPVAVMTVVYYLIVHELKRSNKSELFQNHAKVMQLRLKQNRKATMLLVIIVLVFYVCVIPVNVFYVLYMYNAHRLSDVSLEHVHAILSMLQMANSCVNPIIYSKLHTSFRRSTLRLLCSCCFKKFKDYRWGSFGESFRYAVTTTMSFRSKRSSRGSIASTKDMFYSTRKSLGDINHNANRCREGSISTATTIITTTLSEERGSLDEPKLRKQLSEGEDEVFTPLFGRTQSLIAKSPQGNTHAQEPCKLMNYYGIPLKNIHDSPNGKRKHKKRHFYSWESQNDSRYLSPTTTCKYEYPLKNPSSTEKKKHSSDSDTCRTPSI